MKKETIILAETPITDSTPHTIGDLAAVCRRLERKLAATRQYLTVVTERAKRLEEDLMDAKNKHAALVADVALYEDRGERIKRLEEAGDVLAQRALRLGLLPMAIEGWHKSKEAKP